MSRKLVFGLVLLACGCTTTPQADVMDFVFPSRNACASPSGAVAMQPAVAQPATKDGCCAKCGGKKKDCALCRPFNLFRRNRTGQ